MIQSRRSFLWGAGAALITAPAIVRASSLMQIKQMLDDGKALISMPHPLNNMIATDLTESSLLQLMIEIRKDFWDTTGLRMLHV